MHQGLQHNYSAQIIVYVAVARYVSIAQIFCLAKQVDYWMSDCLVSADI